MKEKHFFQLCWGFVLINICITVVETQPFGPTEQQQLATPSASQEFCVYSKNIYIFSYAAFKSVIVQESEQCTLYCTLEPDCFFTQYNPGNSQCKLYSFVTGCGRYRASGYNHIFSWKTSFISQSTNTLLCEQHAIRTVPMGGGCTALPYKTLQYYSDEEYYRKYGAITGVAMWKSNYFRAIQFRYGDVWAPVRGPDDGIIHSSFILVGNLTFEPGEYINEVHGKGGHHAKHIKLITTKGRVLQNIDFSRKLGDHLLYVHGTNTARIDTLQYPCRFHYIFPTKC